jgi:cysteine desulfurase / selenocysteine lyase
MGKSERPEQACVDKAGEILPASWDADKVPPGVPDPEVLARMVNELFTAWPAASGQDSSRAAADSQLPYSLATTQSPSNAPKVAPPAAPDAFGVTETELRNLPSSLGVSALPASLPVSNGPESVPAISGSVLSTFSVVPSFSFLEEARPIFSTMPASPLSSAVPTAVTNFPESMSPGFPQQLSNPSAIFGSSPVSAPASPGAWTRLNATEMARSFQFLDEIRRFPTAEDAITPKPIGAQAIGLPNLGLSSRVFEVGEIRRDFPILQERVNGRQLVWLDNAATTQKPQSVIDRLSYFYAHENSNIHRAAHELAARATDAYEAAREKARRFLNASSSREIIFVRGATEGINLVAQSWGWQNVGRGDEIVITWLEHHANIVPWQMLCAEKGAHLRVAPVDNRGEILLDEYQKLLGPRTRLVALPQVSNALGTVTPAREMIEMAHRYGAKVLLDGAQAVSHMPVNVQILDCDFYVFSGHKVFAPTGIGVVYGKSDVLDQTPPWQGGGNMITDVTFEKTSYQVPPGRFEAGTGNIADAVGLGAAIDYVERIGMANIERYEHGLLLYALEALRAIPGLHLIGSPKEQAGVISFVLDGFRTEDVGAALNLEGIAARSGHHCAQPILRRFGVEASVRASLALYNTCEEIDALVAAIWNLKQGRAPGLL